MTENLIGVHLVAFWDYYLVPKPTSYNDEIAQKLVFLKKNSKERNTAILEWGEVLGHKFEINVADDTIHVGKYQTTESGDKGLEEAVGILALLLEGKQFINKEKKVMAQDVKIELFTVDSKGKTRISINELKEVEGGFEIHRTTGLKGGKLTPQPVKTITAGKSKRTPKEQAELEFNAIIKKQKDKGYKSEGDLDVADDATDEEISAALGTKRTTADGFNKPMGAKDFTTVKKKDSIYSKDWWASLKIDGIRTLIHPEETKLIFKSRGGLVFKGVATRFELDQKLVDICNKYNCEIDGEFYMHGVPLEIISGACRLDDYVPERHDFMQLFIFDIADDFRTFDQRKLVLDEIRELLAEDDKYVVIDHTLITGEAAFRTFHEAAVADGYEGLILRDGTKLYQFGKKNAAMFKEKLFQDEEFEVVGWKPGLRPTEDMTFILKLPNGDTFEAKPMGDLVQKEWYVENMETLIGQFGTVKFFYYTSKGIPFLPSFKAFRPMDNSKVLI